MSHDVVHAMIDHFSNSSQKMKILKMISQMSIGFAQREDSMQSIHGFGYKIVAQFLTNVEMVVLMILFGYGCKF
jgi:thermostable 8-oxoguanine DNA glycosylase